MPRRAPELWRATVYRYSESPAVANGVVCVGAQAFRASDGDQLWDAGCSCYSSVVSNGRVYVTIDYSTYAYGL